MSILSFRFGVNGTGPDDSFVYSLARFTNNGLTFGSAIAEPTNTNDHGVGPFGYFEFERSGATLYARYGGIRGQYYHTFWTAAVTTEFTTAPDKIGAFVFGAATGVTLVVDWFRREA